MVSPTPPAVDGEVVVDQLVGDLAVRRAPLERGRLDHPVAQPDRAERRRGEDVGRPRPNCNAVPVRGRLPGARGRPEVPETGRVQRRPAGARAGSSASLAVLRLRPGRRPRHPREQPRRGLRDRAVPGQRHLLQPAHRRSSPSLALAVGPVPGLRSTTRTRSPTASGSACWWSPPGWRPTVARLREDRERRIHDLTRVARVAQDAVLTPVPPTSGALRLAVGVRVGEP